MKKTDKNLILAVDMCGCPNRCRHCWLGHMPNKKMNSGDDGFIVNFFKPYFNSVTYYSWLREPDFCENYAERWRKDNEISVNTKPQRFELASFYRLVRDKEYVKFLKQLNIKSVQLTFFGLENLSDKYVGRKGAFNELMKASDLLIKNKIAPRWQAFINQENSLEIVELLKLSQKLNLEKKCKDFGGKFTFFVHSGSCDGENRKLYNIRINKKDVPNALIPYYNDFDNMLTEAELCKKLANDFSHFVYHNENEVVLNISNQFDVFFNFTHMTDGWKIGNLKSDSQDEIIQQILTENTPALNIARSVTVAELVKSYGDFSSDRIFDEYDYKAYLLNKHIENCRLLS